MWGSGRGRPAGWREHRWDRHIPFNPSQGGGTHSLLHHHHTWLCIAGQSCDLLEATKGTWLALVTFVSISQLINWPESFSPSVMHLMPFYPLLCWPLFPLKNLQHSKKKKKKKSKSMQSWTSCSCSMLVPKPNLSICPIYLHQILYYKAWIPFSPLSTSVFQN